MKRYRISFNGKSILSKGNESESYIYSENRWQPLFIGLHIFLDGLREENGDGEIRFEISEI